MSAEVMLLELGARHVETAASVNQALKAIEREKPSFALLDLNLGNENSITVGKKLAELERALYLRHRLRRARADPGRTRLAPVIQKPYTRETIERALARLVPGERAS